MQKIYGVNEPGKTKNKKTPPITNPLYFNFPKLLLAFGKPPQS